MTTYRADPSAISNHFDDLFSGLGHRGSSFTDVDGLVHDGRTGRFLFMEFKHEGEPVSQAQIYALNALAKNHKNISAWFIRQMNNGTYKIADAAQATRANGAWVLLSAETIDGAVLKERFRAWWDRTPL